MKCCVCSRVLHVHMKKAGALARHTLGDSRTSTGVVVAMTPFAKLVPQPAQESCLGRPVCLLLCSARWSPTGLPGTTARTHPPPNRDQHLDTWNTWNTRNTWNTCSGCSACIRTHGHQLHYSGFLCSAYQALYLLLPWLLGVYYLIFGAASPSRHRKFCSKEGAQQANMATFFGGDLPPP